MLRLLLSLQPVASLTGTGTDGNCALCAAAEAAGDSGRCSGCTTCKTPQQQSRGTKSGAAAASPAPATATAAAARVLPSQQVDREWTLAHTLICVMRLTAPLHPPLRSLGAGSTNPSSPSPHRSRLAPAPCPPLHPPPSPCSPKPHLTSESVHLLVHPSVPCLPAGHPSFRTCLFFTLSELSLYSPLPSRHRAFYSSFCPSLGSIRFQLCARPPSMFRITAHESSHLLSLC